MSARRIPARAAGALLLATLAVAFLGSCELFEPKVALLWTDRPEFFSYAETFNASQSVYKLEIEYRASPARALAQAKPGNKDEAYPDLVAGSWLKGAATRVHFQPLDYLFEDLRLSEGAFYPRLLALGNIDGKQYLLPVSFNLPALLFSRKNTELVSDPFVLGPSRIRELGAAYNRERNGTYDRMGFSPRWGGTFLFTMASLQGAAFKEGSPIAWNGDALDKTVDYVRSWTTEANGSMAAEDDFEFKYLYDPAPKLAESGRVLFAYSTSDSFFTLGEETRGALDFRWIAEANAITVEEGATYIGLAKKGSSRAAAEAFLQWFYKSETQRALLEEAKKIRTTDASFGIAGGFSAIRSVTEQVFPQFYPGLLGHVPPADYLEPPNILPEDWATLRERVVIPYLMDRCSSPAGTEKGDGTGPYALQERLKEWYRQNPRR